MTDTKVPRRVAVVCDDPVPRGQLVEGLTGGAFEASAAELTEGAIFQQGAAPPDLIVLYIAVARASHSVRSLVRLSATPDAPFVVVSVIDDEEIERQAIAMGALAYLVRPVDARQCIPMINTAIARADDLRRLRESESNLASALQESRAASIAIGVLMERLRLDRHGALKILRQQARNRREHMTEIAEELLQSIEHLNTFTSATPRTGSKS